MPVMKNRKERFLSGLTNCDIIDDSSSSSAIHQAWRVPKLAFFEFCWPQPNIPDSQLLWEKFMRTIPHWSCMSKCITVALCGELHALTLLTESLGVRRPEMRHQPGKPVILLKGDQASVSKISCEPGRKPTYRRLDLLEDGNFSLRRKSSPPTNREGNSNYGWDSASRAIMNLHPAFKMKSS